MWWAWVGGAIALWFVVALALALVVGGSIRLADERSPGGGVPDLAVPAPAVRRAGRRRAVPLPTVGIGLVVVALALETTGYVVRLTGVGGPAGQLLSMDAPSSVPRLFVALLLAAAAVAAAAGAGLHGGRRSWWTAVAVVAAGLAAVKAGGTVHADAVRALRPHIGGPGVLLVSALAAAGVLAALWLLSRHDRRDRRRVLSALALFSSSAVGLSAVTGAVADAYGGASRWTASAAYLEELGEAIGAVAVLVAVLVGVAPRLVLPAAWLLRREIDAHGLALPERLPGPREGLAGR